LLARIFTPKNFEKIAAKVGKNAHCCRFHGVGSAGIPNRIRPILSRPHGPKFFSGKNFWFEILWAGFFSARNLKILKIFRSKVEKRKKSWRENWKKKVLVTQLTRFSVVNRSPERRPWNPETRTFSRREISFAGKILPRKLEIAKKFGLKSEKSKKIPDESLYARIFPDGNKNCRKKLVAGKFVPVSLLAAPLLRHQSPEGDGAQCDSVGITCTRNQSEFR
jgi:hypothetical protein